MKQGTKDSKRWYEPTSLNEMSIEDQVGESATTWTTRAVNLADEVFDFLHECCRRQRYKLSDPGLRTRR